MARTAILRYASPMKRSVRTFLFLLFVFFFLVTAPIIIAYSQGYRVDWTNKALVQTGALSLEPRPAPVELLLDDTFEKRSNFVFQNIFAGNLIPRTYHVTIRKEGYYPWRKNLSVAPRLVTEAKNIVLFPLSPPIRELAFHVTTFFLSPTLQSLAVVRAPDEQQVDIIPREEAGAISALRISRDFPDFRITHIKWNKNATRLLLALESKNSKKETRWTLLDMRTNNPRIVDLPAIPSAQVTQPRWNPQNPSEILFIARNTRSKDTSSPLFFYNTDTEKLSPSLAHDVLFYTIQGNKILYISSQLLSLNSFDRASGEIQQLSYYPLLHIEKDSAATFLDLAQPAIRANGAVYIFDSKTKIFQKIADNITGVRTSSDARKLLILKKNSLHVYWLQDTHTQPFRNTGEQEEVWFGASPLVDAVWVGKNDEHLIFANGDSIYVTELDRRDTRNTQKLVAKSATKIHYEESEKILYLLSDNTLLALSLK